MPVTRLVALAVAVLMLAASAPAAALAQDDPYGGGVRDPYGTGVDDYGVPVEPDYGGGVGYPDCDEPHPDDPYGPYCAYGDAGLDQGADAPGGALPEADSDTAESPATPIAGGVAGDSASSGSLLGGSDAAAGPGVAHAGSVQSVTLARTGFEAWPVLAFGALALAAGVATLLRRGRHA